MVPVPGTVTAMTGIPGAHIARHATLAAAAAALLAPMPWPLTPAKTTG